MEEENIKIAIAKLKKVFNVKTQKQLAEVLGISHAAIDSWKHSNKLPNRYKRYLNNIDNKKIDQIQIGHRIVGDGNFVDNNNISFYNNDKKAIENIKRGNITINTKDYHVDNTEIEELLELLKDVPSSWIRSIIQKLKKSIEAIDNDFK